MAELIGAILAIAILFGLIKGAVQTFQRNWFVALVLVIVLPPIWVFWVLFEIFLPTPQTRPIEVHVTNVNK